MREHEGGEVVSADQYCETQPEASIRLPDTNPGVFVCTSSTR